jgi:glycopeptide antibiotics resistance protein
VRWRYSNILVLVLCVFALVAVTMLPGAWKLAIESSLFPRRFPASALGHFLLFALVGVCLSRAPFSLRLISMMGVALLAALTTEALQHFVVGRHPRLMDVGIDLLGALSGAGLVARYRSGQKKSV